MNEQDMAATSILNQKSYDEGEPILYECSVTMILEVDGQVLSNKTEIKKHLLDTHWGILTKAFNVKVSDFKKIKRSRHVEKVQRVQG
jgi:hypothetical protein